MPGSRSLRKIQFGLESTPGTAVAATALWRGRGVIHDRYAKNYPNEDVGILGGEDRSYTERYWSELALEPIEATFEQLPYLFEMGLAEETPTQDGTGSDYIYNYLSPTTAQNTIGTYTFEGGDDQQAEEFDYGFAKQITLTGEGTGALMMSANIFGRQTSNSTFTGAIAIPTVEEILFNNAKLYIDDEDGTVGTTEVANTIFALNLSINTGVNEYWTADGSKDFSSHKFTVDELIARVTYEHNASAVTEKAKYRDNSSRLFRILCEGSDFATPGSTYTKHSLVLDFAGKYEDWSPLDENQGNDIVEATVRIRYNKTAALKFDATVVNELTALP